MTLQRIPLTEAARRLKQIRQTARDEGLVVLTSHDKPVLIVIEVERGKQLLEDTDRLSKLLAADSLLGFVRAIGAADKRRFGANGDWIGQALADLQDDERVS